MVKKYSIIRIPKGDEKMKLIVKRCNNEMGFYYTIINPKNGAHCHSLSSKEVILIQNCFDDMEHGKPIHYPAPIRKKTARLVLNVKIMGR